MALGKVRALSRRQLRRLGGDFLKTSTIQRSQVVKEEEEEEGGGKQGRGKQMGVEFNSRKRSFTI